MCKNWYEEYLCLRNFRMATCRSVRNCKQIRKEILYNYLFGSFVRFILTEALSSLSRSRSFVPSVNSFRNYMRNIMESVLKEVFFYSIILTQ